MDWRLHWLEAEGEIGPWRARIEAEIAAAREAVDNLLPAHRLDIVVQRTPDDVIPETGETGRAWRKGLLSISVDPDNPNFETSLANGILRRTVAHEVHHCRRMAGPGYGETLGEALVSEGLAGRFVRCLFGSPSEPWECAVDDHVLDAHWPDTHAMSAPYDHTAWFFGAGEIYPRWLGYTLGDRIVARWLATCGTIDGDMWVNVPAARVLRAASR